MANNPGALSQDDIDSLLESINSSESLSLDESLSNVISSPTGKKQKVKVYDFKRPDKFSKEQVRTVSSFHEAFARYTTTSLSALLRKMVHVHVASVDQLTYEEFIRSIPNPTTLAIINMDPLKGSAIFEVDPTIAFAIVDRLFGGDGDTIKDKSRDLTEIEQSVMESVIIRILANMREAWSQVVDLRPRFGHIEVNPQFAQIVPPTEMIILVTLEVKIGKVEGLMNFCLPYITIEPIVSKLSTRYWHSLIGVGTTSENLDALREKLENTAMPLIAEIGEVKLKVREILSLDKGDVLNLESSPINKDLTLKVGTKEKFKCRMGLMGNKVSVQITEKIGDIKGFDLLKELTEEVE